MLFDTHTHPYITFKKSPEINLEHFFGENKSNRCISIGCDIPSSKKSIDLAKYYPRLKASIGFHPCDLPYSLLNSFLSSQDTSVNSSPESLSLELHSIHLDLLQEEIKLQIERDIDTLRNLYFGNKEYTVAIGEIGLDYYHLVSLSESSGLSQDVIKKIQKSYFRAQIQLAFELSLPFIIHSRESNEDVLDILSQEQAKNYVFHCYSGDWSLAQRILAQNSKAMFGFGGPLTFKKSLELQEVASKLQLDRIFIETDAPFLTPEPLRGREENETLYVHYVLKKLQELRDESPKEVEKAVYDNAMRFFQIV